MDIFERDKPMTIVEGLRRMFVYGKPYWVLIVVTFVSMIVYSVGLNGRAVLIKPFVDEVILPAEELRAEAKSDVQATLDPTGLGLSDFAKKEVSEEELEAGREKIRTYLDEHGDQVFFLLLLAVLVVSLIPLTNLVKTYCASYVTQSMIRNLQCDLCEKFLHMPLAFHNRAEKGEIFARLNSDVGRTAASFQLIFGDLIQEPVTLMVGMAAMFYLSWQLSLFLLLVVPFLVLIIVFYGRKIRRRSIHRQQIMGNQMGTMMQMFSGIKVVKAFRMEEVEGNRFRQINQDLFLRNMRVVKANVISGTLTEAFNNFLYILLFVIGVFAILKAMLGLTLAVLMAFMALTTTLYRPVKHLSRSYNMVSDSMAGVQRVCEVLDLEPETAMQDGHRALEGVKGKIVFDGVCFSYDGVRHVLSDIAFEVKKGETVAFVGKTGVGKTTLCDLIPRFYDPTEGRILFDGVDLREFTRDSLLSHIAVVTQEPFLFDTTVEENIRYGRLDATREEIRDAARAAFIHDKIESLPEGYATRVGDRGARLSGGERQRVTIARAILRNPSLLILDEATSSLDAESEKWVKKAIDNLMEGRTTFVIAHRLSTIRNADKIVVLEDGRVSNIGRHEELMERAGLYRELCAMQFEHDVPPVGDGHHV